LLISAVISGTAFPNSDPESNNDLEIVGDAEMQGLSLYEKKSLLISRELDSMGMGRYQWCIWALCGLGYMLDLLWAQAFGLIATPLQHELGFSGECSRTLPS